MRTFLLAFTLSLCLNARGEPIVLDESISPNGRYYLSIEPSPDDFDAGNGTLQVRAIHTKKILGSFEWGQFGPKISSKSSSVIWRSDSKAFALTTYTNRGWTGSEVYALDGSKWVSLVIPRFKTPYPAEDGWKTRSKGHFIAVAWVSNDSLKMNYDDEPYRFDQGGQVVFGTGLWIYLKLLPGPSLDVVRVETMKAPDAAEQ